ncbi:hypothetical protein NEOLEDRAFT_9972 [Neolentinus lepideus HHB14362 ss-1]|uniref:Uncharacterized protein n=1 Tax=Neolentinus lepideus HHB14362 ss-1 TaxID=1314782 RepID=A0A165VZU1_9AGAM|nr:hypothetical protein NEOLEDRAFT_9972 [Neolentinus lepideus HHB14362 ss-1]
MTGVTRPVTLRGPPRNLGCSSPSRLRTFLEFLPSDLEPPAVVKDVVLQYSIMATSTVQLGRQLCLMKPPLNCSIRLAAQQISAEALLFLNLGRLFKPNVAGRVPGSSIAPGLDESGVLEPATPSGGRTSRVLAIYAACYNYSTYAPSAAFDGTADCRNIVALASPRGILMAGTADCILATNVMLLKTVSYFAPPGISMSK